jgi:hypothetical protein
MSREIGVLQITQMGESAESRTGDFLKIDWELMARIFQDP